MSTPLFESEREFVVREDGIHVFRRRPFFSEYFDYKKGQHVVFGGTSQWGKTTLAFDAMEYIVTPDFPAYVAVSKPQDPVTAQRGAELGFRRVSEWPPPVKLQEMSILGGSKPKGYLVWSQFGDLTTDMERCAEITSKLLMERYAHGASKKNTGGILVMDDTMVKAKIMGLDKQMTTILAMAGAMKLGLWVFVQRASGSGNTALWAYEQASHLFFTKGGDAAQLKRYSEIIGGENAPVARRVIPTLGQYEFLYVNNVTGHMCIVGKDY